MVHDHWFQISSSIASVEGLFEDEDFSHRQLAALLASKVPPLPPLASPPEACPLRPVEPRSRPCPPLWPLVQVFYHLGELDDALTYALGADTLFDINEKSEYVQTLLGGSTLPPFLRNS